MTGRRFIALIAKDEPSRSAWEQASARTLADMKGFEKQIIGSRLVLVAEAGAALAVGSEGFVIGAVFARGHANILPTIDADTARSIVASRGDWLICAHWGSYLALLSARDRDSIEIIRAPLGDLACYFLSSPHGLFVASDVDLLMRFAGFVPEVDWSALARHLAAVDLCRRHTCLRELGELSGGERLTDIAGRWTIDRPWQIWDFVDARKRLTEPAEAMQRVRDAVQMAVAAQASAHCKIVLRLSGGLDSSIVAACLTRANRSLVALTLVTRDRSGDEREQARTVASHLGVPLVEAARDKNLVDLETSDAHGLPRPSARGFAQASARIAHRVAHEYGASAIFDGGGGDNMFGSLKSPAPVADCLRTDGGVGHFWRTARSIGIAAHTSTLDVARRALVRTWTRGPAYRWPVDFSLLSAEARNEAASAVDHPWLVPPDGALAGSAAHVALLAAAQSVAQSRDARVARPDISPLIAQPVAEACLRVPSWLWTRDGHNRAIARDAFRDALPQAIINRRDKGAPDSFVVELIDANLSLIRDMLTNGLLARQGLLDTATVALALTPTAIAKGFGYVRLMQLVDAEAWVRSWLGRGGSPG